MRRRHGAPIAPQLQALPTLTIHPTHFISFRFVSYTPTHMLFTPSPRPRPHVHQRAGHALRLSKIILASNTAVVMASYGLYLCPFFASFHAYTPSSKTNDIHSQPTFYAHPRLQPTSTRSLQDPTSDLHAQPHPSAVCTHTWRAAPTMNGSSLVSIPRLVTLTPTTTLTRCGCVCVIIDKESRCAARAATHAYRLYPLFYYARNAPAWLCSMHLLRELMRAALATHKAG